MIAVDTNVLLRIAVVDTPEQSERARRLFESAAATGTTVVVSPIVLVETVWALRKVFRQPQGLIAAFLEKVLRTPFIQIVDRDIVQTAVVDYTAGRADFADYLIAAYAERENVTATYSFDADAIASRRFIAVP